MKYRIHLEKRLNEHEMDQIYLFLELDSGIYHESVVKLKGESDENAIRRVLIRITLSLKNHE